MTRPCFLCGADARWRGVIGTTRQFTCDEHAGLLELLKRRHPFQSSVKVVARESGTVRAAWPGRVETNRAPSLSSPRSGNFDGGAA